MVAKPPHYWSFPTTGAVYLQHVKINSRILEEEGAGHITDNDESELRRSNGVILI